MKAARFITLIILGMVLYFTASCVVLLKENNGKHKGWYKNTNNPHNPKSTKRGKHGGKTIRLELKTIMNKENTERAQPSLV